MTVPVLPYDSAYSSVMAFVRRFGEAHVTLAMHAAFPLGLSPELVHLIRINLVPEAPFIAEADILLSSMCREVGGGLYEMDGSVRELLLDELVSDVELGPRQLFRVADFVIAYAEQTAKRTSDPDLRRFLGVQRLTALARLEPEQAAQELIRELESAQQQHDVPRIVRNVRLSEALAAPLAGQWRLASLAATLKRDLGDADSGSAGRRDARRPPHRGAGRYVTAKVVVLGDAGVGKSGLSLVLSGQAYHPTESTHGRNVWKLDTQQVKLPDGGTQTREILLWDLAGQPGYRLIHQLHLSEVSVALIVFDSRGETDPFAGVKYWAAALAQARRLEGAAVVPLRTFLVAGRADRGGVTVSRERVQAMLDDLGLDGFFETSAKEGWQIPELAQAIRDGVAWDALPMISSPALFSAIREFLTEAKEQGRLLSTVDDLLHGFQRARPEFAGEINLRASFVTCIGRVESRGLIRRLHFGDLVLLQPELLDAYASSMVQAAREEADGLGFIPEQDAIDGRFRLPEHERITDRAQERLLLIATVEELLRYEIALKVTTDRGVDLVFPSQITRERPDAPDIPGRQVVFTFEGPLYSIYATLAVRLSHSTFFLMQTMWQNAASYVSSSGGTCSIQLHELEEGRGELALFFDEHAGVAARAQFETYVAEHLQLRALPGTITRRQIRACPNCGYVLPEDLVQRRLELGATTIRCPVCEQHVFALTEEPSAASEETLAEMNRSADDQRDRNVAAARLRGKIETKDYDVFLCYNSRDREQVMAIGERLKEVGILPWLDVWETRPGRRWQAELENQINSIKSTVVFIGPKGTGPWQELEVEALLTRLIRRKRPVIPVILEGRRGEPRLPAFLSEWQLVDMRQPDPDPFRQLVWAITGGLEI